MLTVSQITKSFGGRRLFFKTSLQVNRGDRIGLIGANGAGKSTLFSIILGDTEPDEGSVSLQRGITMGYLAQETASVNGETVLQLASAEHENYSLEAKAKRILSGLAFRETDFDRPIAALSGGWIMRAHLARLLVQEPDLLLLDEPTNHLDLESLQWFQKYLQGYRGAILTISHDRGFLNAVCDSIIEVSRERFHRYTGNYDSYVLQRKTREEQYLAAYKNQQKEIAHLEQFINRFRAKASKAAQAQARIKQLAKMERLAPPEPSESVVKFRFPQPARSGQKVITLENIGQAYGERVIYDSLNLTIEREQRTVLVGPNGAGKSTLLKILANQLPLFRGEPILGSNVSVGYFAQQRLETLDPNNSVLQEATLLPKHVSDETARTVLGSFLFRGEDVFKPVKILSGGEKSRLSLAKLLLNPPNLLLLDEPTTHLDMPSIDALVGALQQYEGTLVFISHDVYFIRALATTVLHVQAGHLTFYAGNYDYYLEKSCIASEKEALVAKLHNYQPEHDPHVCVQKRELSLKEIRVKRSNESEARKAMARTQRAHQLRLEQLEARILELERSQKELTEQIEKPFFHKDTFLACGINQQLKEVTAALGQVNKEWNEVVEQLSSLKSG